MRWLGGNNSVVECDLAKVEVAGSNPVSRSNFDDGAFVDAPLSCTRVPEPTWQAPLRGAPYARSIRLPASPSRLLRTRFFVVHPS